MQYEGTLAIVQGLEQNKTLKKLKFQSGLSDSKD